MNHYFEIEVALLRDKDLSSFYQMSISVYDNRKL